MPKEPLQSLSRFSFDWANTLCDPEHGCAPYHRMWSFIRLLESGGALPNGQTFFGNAINIYSQNGKVHIMVSGGADTGVMAIAVTEAKAQGLRLQVTSVDRCLTPLMGMRLYGAYCNVPVTTIHRSIENIPSDLDVDLVFSHSFLGFIPAKLRETVMIAWFQALRPGGAVVLSQRLGEVQGKSKVSWPEDAIKIRRFRLSNLISKHGNIVTSEEENEFLIAAENFWKTGMNTIDVGKDELESLAISVGFHVKLIMEDIEHISKSPFSFSEFVSRPPKYKIILEKPLI